MIKLYFIKIRNICPVKDNVKKITNQKTFLTKKKKKKQIQLVPKIHKKHMKIIKNKVPIKK